MDTRISVLAESDRQRKFADFCRMGFMEEGAVTRVGAADQERVLVRLPNGETRTLTHGLNSLISRAVIETFAKQYLEKPAVLWLSESGSTVAMKPLYMSCTIGLDVQAQMNLSGLIILDLGSSDPLILFIEVVATDGVVTARRQDTLFDLMDKGDCKRSQVAFCHRYADRESTGFKKSKAGFGARLPGL